MIKDNKIFIIIGLVICLISLNGVMAMASYCGDGVCTNIGDYTESNPLTSWFCPLDCGDGIITSRWCEDTFSLRSGDCPTYNTYPTCDLTRISDSDKNNWCSSNGYSNIPSIVNKTNTENSDLSKYYWIIFLIVGGIVGYYIKNK